MRRLIPMIMCVILALAAPSVAPAAKLAGGKRETALRQAFTREPRHRGLVIISIRVSSVTPGWAVVKSVRSWPSAGGRTAGITQLSPYYHETAGQEKPARPPRKAKADLDKSFRVRFEYRGSGSESFHYNQKTTGQCGSGTYMNAEAGTVDPMSWDVRYVVNLDKLVMLLNSPQGVVAVPQVTFDFRHSSVHVLEVLTRDASDTGCAGSGTHIRCTLSYHPTESAAAGVLAFLPRLGTEISVPSSIMDSGDCLAQHYSFNPSRGDGGGTTALAGSVDVVGGRLPANPYAPVSVSWPAGSFLQKESALNSPCSNVAVGCTAQFHWSGQVRLSQYP